MFKFIYLLTFAKLNLSDVHSVTLKTLNWKLIFDCDCISHWNWPEVAFPHHPGISQECFKPNIFLMSRKKFGWNCSTILTAKWPCLHTSSVHTLNICLHLSSSSSTAPCFYRVGPWFTKSFTGVLKRGGEKMHKLIATFK